MAPPKRNGILDFIWWRNVSLGSLTRPLPGTPGRPQAPVLAAVNAAVDTSPGVTQGVCIRGSGASCLQLAGRSRGSRDKPMNTKREGREQARDNGYTCRTWWSRGFLLIRRLFSKLELLCPGVLSSKQTNNSTRIFFKEHIQERCKICISKTENAHY